MGSGTLRCRIDIETPTQVSDGAGGFTQTWALLKKSWAGISPKITGRGWLAERYDFTVTHDILMRYDSEIRPKMRIKYRERIFVIHGMANRSEKDRFIRLLCEEKESEC